MYYLLLVSIFAATFNSIFLNRAQVNKKGEIFKFNLFVALLWGVIIFVINKGHIFLNTQVLLWGVAYGITQALFILFKIAAMSSGPVSVTTLIGNCSLLISVVVSLVVWKEKVTAVDISGLFLLILSIFMCTGKKEDGQYKKAWKYYVVFFLIFAAMVGIVFKAFGKAENSAYCDDMMFTASCTMIIFYSISCIFFGSFKLKNNAKSNKVRFLAYSLICGLLSFLYNRLNIFLAGTIDAIIFFPAFNGGVILLSALFGVLICREKLTMIQKAGFITGIMAICLIGIL